MIWRKFAAKREICFAANLKLFRDFRHREPHFPQSQNLFAELLFLANEKSEDEKIVALKTASDEIIRNTGLQNADAAAVSKLAALSLDWDLGT